MPQVPDLNIPKFAANKYEEMNNKGTKEFARYEESNDKTNTKPIKVTNIFNCSKCGKWCNNNIGVKEHWLLEH